METDDVDFRWISAVEKAGGLTEVAISAPHCGTEGFQPHGLRRIGP
jgi:hypothetical protein